MDNSNSWSVETARLQLREFTLDDCSLMHELESIPEVVRYQEWEPRTLEQATAVVETIVQNQTKIPRNHVELALITKDHGDFVGRVGSKVDHETKKADIWFAILPKFQGKGLAREAVEALLNVVLVQGMGVRTCEVECDPRNEGSWRLAERLGFTKITEVDKAWESKGEWVGSKVYRKELTE